MDEEVEVDNLVNLVQLTEDTILNNLRKRFEKDHIYTYVRLRWGLVWL